MKLFITSLILGLASGAATAAGHFTTDSFIEKCGGKIYSKCDSPGLDQDTVFEAGRAEALKKGVDIMVVVGADWCTYCRKFHEMIAADKDADKLHERVVFIQINGDAASAKAMAKRLKISYTAYPQAFVLKAETNELLQQFYPSSFKSVEALLENLNLKNTAAKVLEKPYMVGAVHASSMELPIEIVGDYGPSSFIPDAKLPADKFVNQGVAALQVYHYLDAFRSFKMAEKLDPNSVYAQVGQVLAAVNMDSTAASAYFTLTPLQKIEIIAKTRALTPAESAWFNFAKSYQMANSSNYVKVPGREIKSLIESYGEIMEKDKNNLDGQSLIVWFALTSLGNTEAKSVLKNVLKQAPDNIGAHHSLLHIAESENDAREATAHAVPLAKLVPGSAHAQHMYGHTLPQQGRWADALAMFKKADDLHQAWAKKYNLSPGEDWHYSHNLDLMAAAYLGLGDLNKAMIAWLAASGDPRALMHVIALQVITDSRDNADKMIKMYEDVGFRDYMKPYRDELELTPEKAKALGAAVKAPSSGYQALVDKLLASYAAGNKEVSPALSTEVSDYFAKSFKSGGFDGWSNAYLQLLRLKRVAKILSMDKFIASLAPLEFAVQNGSLCGSSEKEKSLVRCGP